MYGLKKVMLLLLSLANFNMKFFLYPQINNFMWHILWQCEIWNEILVYLLIMNDDNKRNYTTS